VRTLIRSNMGVWKEYVQHDFVKQLGQGTLSRERFIHFLKCATTVTVPACLLYSPTPHRQDYLYLKYYARANGYGSFRFEGSAITFIRTVSWSPNPLHMPNLRRRQRLSFPS
jgi:hypothetical protein